MANEYVPTTVRGVVRCPVCRAPGLWLAEVGGSGAFVIPIPRREVNLLVREFSAQKTWQAPMLSLLERVVASLGSRKIAIRMWVAGRGRLRAELSAQEDESVRRVPLYPCAAAVLAHRRRTPVFVPSSLLVPHDGLSAPLCANEVGDLPPAPPEFMRFLDWVTAQDFRTYDQTNPKKDLQ